MAKILAEHDLLFCSIGLLSIVIPVGIFIARHSIRATRGQLVEDLARRSSFVRGRGGSRLIVPSFELIKSRDDASGYDTGNGRPAPA
jgi:hypothetical protein